jgi:hypothetical protein
MDVYYGNELGSLGVALSGPDEPWKPDDLARIVAHLQGHFLAPLDAMRLRHDAPWQPIERDPILATFRRVRQPYVDLRAQDPGLRLTISGRVGLVADVLPDRYPTLGAEAVLRFVRETAAVIPGFQYAWASAVRGLGPLWMDRKWPFLPQSFDTELFWWQALAPSRFQADYTREALLGAPARVEEWPDGTIALRTFDDPFAWSAPETLAELEKVVLYLDANRTRPGW